jgi:hypothetical protein
MRAPDPVVTFIVVLVIGLAAGFLFDRLAGLARQFSGSTRGIVTSALVGMAGALIGYHIAVLLGARRRDSDIGNCSGARGDCGAVPLGGWLNNKNISARGT